MRIDLHLGVHKTATTHLQRYWLQCSKELGTTKVIPNADVRTHITTLCKPLSKDDEGSAQREHRQVLVNEWLARSAEGAPGLVLSDENMIGNCAMVFERQALYTNVLPRLRLLAQALQDHEVRLWLCVRDYSSFLRSAYCEVLRHAAYQPFRRMFKKFDVSERGWEHVVADIHQAFPSAELRCWQYETLPRLRPSITASLLDTDPIDLPEPDSQRDRQSYSQMAVDLLDTIYKRVDPEHATRVRSTVVSVVGGQGLPGFDPWTEDERAAFAKAYESSVQAIQKQPGVIWLG